MRTLTIAAILLAIGLFVVVVARNPESATPVGPGPALLPGRPGVAAAVPEAPAQRLVPTQAMDTRPGAEANLHGRVLIVDSTTGDPAVSGRWIFRREVPEPATDTVEVDLGEDRPGVLALGSGTWTVTAGSAGWIVHPSEFVLPPDSEVVLSVGRSGSCRVFVTDERGRAVSGAHVWTIARKASPWTSLPHVPALPLGNVLAARRTDSSGFLELPILQPGPLVVTASEAGLGAASRTVLPAPGETVEIVLQEMSSTISVRVVDAATRQPVEGASLQTPFGVPCVPSDAQGELTYWEAALLHGPVALTAPGYVPVNLEPQALQGPSAITLHRRARLRWQVVETDGAGALETAAFFVSLSPLVGGVSNPVYLPRWSQRSTTTGTFIVPLGGRVTITATAGALSASSTIEVADVESSVELLLEFPRDSLVVDVPHPGPDPTVQVEYENLTRVEVTCEEGQAVVPRCLEARRIRVPCEGGFLLVSRDARAADTAPTGTLELEVPSSLANTLRVVDGDGRRLSGVKVELRPISAGLLDVRSSHPGWKASYFEPTPGGRTAVDGTIAWPLPGGDYTYDVWSADGRVQLAEGGLEVHGASRDHTIVVGPARWVSLHVQWPDGSNVQRFEVRYSVPWSAQPESPWALRRGSGLNGWYATWMPASTLELQILAEGGRALDSVLAPEITTHEVTLYRLEEPLLVDLVGVDEPFGHAILGVFSFGREYIESVALRATGTPGRFCVPEASILDARMVMVTVETDSAAYESELMTLAQLQAGPVHLRIADE